MGIAKRRVQVGEVASIRTAVVGCHTLEALEGLVILLLHHQLLALSQLGARLVLAGKRYIAVIEDASDDKDDNGTQNAEDHLPVLQEESLRSVERLFKSHLLFFLFCHFYAFT